MAKLSCLIDLAFLPAFHRANTVRMAIRPLHALNMDYYTIYYVKCYHNKF